MKDYFSVLGLPRYASEDDIKEAYRRLALRWHPDLNLDSDEAERMMQDLNRAKEVLFEQETREDYRRLLDMQDTLSYENLQRIRQKYKDEREGASPEIELRYPFRRTKVAVVIGIAVLLVGAAAYWMSTASSGPAADPVQSILERHIPATISLPQKQNLPTPSDSAETIEQIATVSAMMGDYRTAASYWEYLLQHNSYRLSTVTNLALAKIRLKDYAGAFGVIATYASGADHKLLLYTTLGDYFKSELQPFDAKDSYRKALELLPSVDTTQATIQEAIHRCTEGISN